MPHTKAKILVVDDEHPIRSTLSLILTESGYQVRCANDGFSALLELRGEVPDLIVSDLNMPGMSGFELLTVVRHRFPAVSVIAMSGSFSGDQVPTGVAADAFYQKGNGIVALLGLIESLPWPERLASRRPLAPAPVRVQAKEPDGDGKWPRTMSCPECLRTFTPSLDCAAGHLTEPSCTFCRNTIHLAASRPAETAALLPFRRGQTFEEPSLRRMGKLFQ
jgi:CheY-like chemotaxis protein